MSKKPDELPNEQQEQKKQPAHVEELMKNGKVVLEANSREELFAKYGELQADADGTKLSCGCVGQTADGNFVMNVSIIKE